MAQSILKGMEFKFPKLKGTRNCASKGVNGNDSASL